MEIPQSQLRVLKKTVATLKKKKERKKTKLFCIPTTLRRAIIEFQPYKYQRVLKMNTENTLTHEGV